MRDIVCASKLAFFKAERYEYKRYNTFDTSDCPRPHFCMGLVLSGEGVYTNCETGEDVKVFPGDIIFVPMGSRYVSKWTGNPEISYVSMHFIFDHPGSFFKRQKFKLQKITPMNFEKTKDIFEYVIENYDKNECAKLSTLSKFFGILGDIVPELAVCEKKEIDSRLEKTVDYIEKNYNKDISVESLAEISNMSISRFFPAFKKSFGMTPVEYINNYRISRAIILMMNDRNMPIERMSEELGFESSAYFRRVFKRVTGKNPREYRKNSMEM